MNRQNRAGRLWSAPAAMDLSDALDYCDVDWQPRLRCNQCIELVGGVAPGIGYWRGSCEHGTAPALEDLTESDLARRTVRVRCTT